jgi:uncharacterized protein (TIGR03437 family)
MMRRVLVFVLLLSGLAVSVSSQSSPNVSLTWIGQSGFLVQTEKGPTVISDPPSNNLGFLFPATPADVVTVSHIHGDHTNIAAVQGTPVLIDGRNATEFQEVIAGDMSFTVIPGFHDVQGMARNSIITWTQGGIRFAQCGDYGQATLTRDQMNNLRGIDVAFIAASTPTTPPTLMKEFIEQLRPRIAILSHFRMPLGGFSGTLPFQDIIAPFTGIVYKPNTVILNRGTLPATPEIWVMQPLSKTITVNAASYAEGVPAAPRSLGTVFGSFANAATMTASSYPLPTMLGNVEVAVGGKPAPLLYVSPSQINFQVSGELQTPGQALAEVKVNGVTVGRTQVTTLPGAPGLFLATDMQYQSVSSNAPTGRGLPIIIWATGYGELSGALGDGQPAPLSPLLTTQTMPLVTIGGIEAQVIFSGPAPGTIGVWQINAVVPADAPLGSNVPLVVTQGLASNTLNIAIR